MIKLIVSDIDGTLANSKGEIDTDIFEIVPELHKKGIIFVPASGRPYENIVGRFAPIKDNLTIISDNGAMVMMNDKPLSIIDFDKKTLDELIHFGRQNEEWIIIATGVKTSYIENGSKEFLDYVKQFFTKSVLVDNLFDVDDRIIKYTICRERPDMNDIFELMVDFHDKAEVKIAGKNWLDVNPKGVSKGLAVTKLQDLFNITPQETMAFGDYMNDFEMLKAAHHSFAPANACDEIKQIVKEVVECNDEQCVTRTIRRVLDI